MKNRFQKYLSLTVALLIMACMFSCRKPQPQGSSVDGGFKSFFDYQVGSYWIFYDSVLRNYDSLYVGGYQDIAANAYGGFSDELINIGISEYYVDSVLGNTWAITLGGPSAATLNIEPDYEYDYVIANNFPFQKGTISNLGTIYNSYTTTSYTSLTLGNLTYNNVYEITYAYNSSAGDTIYINSDYGFLAVLLHNKYSHKRLFLSKSKLIR